MSDPDELVNRMRADQASDWPDRLLRAIREIPNVPEDEITMTFRRPRDSDLSAREKRVLELLSHGMTMQQAADTLCLGLQTVRTHAAGARYRLRAKTTQHAIACAIRQGLIN